MSNLNPQKSGEETCSMQRNWNINKIILMTDEPLLHLRKLIDVCLLSKFARWFAISILTVHVPLLLLQCYYWYTYPEEKIFTEYGSDTFLYVMVIVPGILPFTHGPSLRQMLKVQNTTYISLQSCSKKLRDNILRICKIVNNISHFVALSTILIYLLILWLGVHLFQLDLIATYFGKLRIVGDIIFGMHLSYIILAMVFASCWIPYLGLNYYFQARILNEQIEEIVDAKKPHINLVYDKIYQRTVKRRLKFCISRHEQLSSAMRTTRKYRKILICVAHFGGLCGVLLSALSWYLETAEIKSTIISIGCLFIQVVGTETIHYIEEELVTSLEKFSFLPWYTFNKENRQNYLLFHLLLSKPFKISPYDKFPVNRDMLVMYCRMFYQLMAILIQLDPMNRRP